VPLTLSVPNDLHRELTPTEKSELAAKVENTRQKIVAPVNVYANKGDFELWYDLPIEKPVQPKGRNR
jgi:hypothetical protein